MLLLIILFLLLVLFFVYKENRHLYFIINKYEEIIKDERMAHHEFNNQLIVLSGFFDCKNYKKANEYLKCIINDIKITNFELKELSKLPNGGIKKLFYNKIYEIETLNIQYSIDFYENIVEPLNSMDLRSYMNVTKILGVLIDNAIHEAKLSEEKEIGITIKKDDNYLIFIITNSISKHTNCKKIGLDGYTTKGLNHGFGLQIIKSIIKNNSKIEVISDVVEKKYNQTILVDL